MREPERVRRLGGDPPSPYETAYSFSRVLRLGNLVLVGGTTSVGPDGEVLGTARPLMTMVEVAGLIDPRMLVEIEAVAAM